MLLKLVFASFTLLYFNGYIQCQICTKRIITTRRVPQTYVYTYRDRNCRLCNIFKRIKTAIGSRNVPRQEMQTISECCPGYTRKDNNDAGIPVCLPICFPPCQNGYCTRPGVCDCQIGFIPDPLHPRNCVPTCSKGCSNGVCIGPDLCRCNFGYEMDGGKCVPVCSDPCVNGNCVAPGTCECFTGYRKSETNECKPYCSKGCTNGICVLPETCECNMGYELRNNSCSPVCSPPCTNGNCIAPDSCECSAGYRKSESNNCIPQCSKDCINGKCVKPDVCECNLRYELNGGLCSPVCSPPCHNGACTAPDRCECFAGYVKERRDCVPYCSKGCTNGKCLRPDVCECNNGYHKVSEGNCEAHCNIPCGNGQCIAPNICNCYPGYKFDISSLGMTNRNVCMPECSDCRGSCIAPNECVCDPPLKTVHLGINGSICDCFYNCTDSMKKCVRTICTNVVTTTTELSTTVKSSVSSTTELSTAVTESVSSTTKQSTTLQLGVSITTDLYNNNSEWSVGNDTDEDYFRRLDDDLDTINTTYFTESHDRFYNKDGIVPDSLKNHDGEKWYWICGAISISTIIILTLLIILIVKRKSIKRYFSEGNYVVEDRKCDDGSEQQNIYEDLRYSSLLERNNNRNIYSN